VGRSVVLSVGCLSVGWYQKVGKHGMGLAISCLQTFSTLRLGSGSCMGLRS
jgi:hypothetical protein